MPQKDYRMPSPKHPCPTCGTLISAKASFCKKHRPYVFSAEHCRNISAAVAGRPKPWLQGRRREAHSLKMKELWATGGITRPAVLNPEARYAGLSARRAKKIVEEAGLCQACGHDGSESRLDIHHRDRNKRN